MAAATIFDRYGGFATIRKVVSDFYDEVLDSPALAHHFAHTDMRELIKHQTVFISYLTGGPGTAYSDEVLHRIHAPLGITHAEFDELLGILRDTLEDHEFDDEDVEVISKEYRRREPFIVAAA